MLRAVRIELAPVWIRICTQIRAPSSKRSIAGEFAEGRYAVIGDTVRVGFAMIGALLLMLLLRSRPQLRPLQDYLQRGQIDTADDGAQGSYGPTQHHFQTWGSLRQAQEGVPSTRSMPNAMPVRHI